MTLGGERISLAEHAGFCAGVERAVRIARETGEEAMLNGCAGVVTLGALVHNPAVVADLLHYGVQQVDSVDEVRGRVAVIPSHGLSPAAVQEAREKGLSLVDATCPHVLRVQREVAKAHENGHFVVLVGDRLHPEARAVVPFASGGIAVVSGCKEAAVVELPEAPVTVVAQTTQILPVVEAVVDVIAARGRQVRLVNTICPATSLRQEAARRLARSVDLMVVIGGRTSANTMRLAEVCSDTGVRVLKIQSADELDLHAVHTAGRIGVTAGASTPSWVIEEVMDAMNEIIEGNPEEVRQSEQQAEQADQVEQVEQAKQADQVEQAEQVEVEAVPEAEAKPEGEPPETAPVESEPEETQVEAEAGGIPQAVSAPEAEAEVVPEPEAETRPQDEAAQVDTAPTEPAEEEKTAAPTEPEAKPEPAAPARTAPPAPETVTARVEEIYDDRVIVQLETGETATIVLKSLSADAISHPSEVVAPGEEIQVVLEKHSRGSDTLFASKRQADRLLLWNRLENAKETGEVIEGKVTEAVKGGLVVDIGVRGFVPASQVGRRFVEDLSVYVGQELKMKVREVERLRSNVVLSQRDYLEEQEKLAREHAFQTLERGQVITGSVTRLAVFGAFVDIGDGVEGLLHISDISWARIKHPGEVLSENQEVQVLVLNVDRERERISLGYKQLQPDPWENVGKRFPVGSIVTGTVTKLVEFGAFVSLEEGIEGLVHISQLADRRIARPDEVVAVGQTVTVKVIGLREQEHRISLSIRQAIEEGERNEYRKYMKDNREDNGVTIGDRVAYDPSKLKGADTDGE